MLASMTGFGRAAQQQGVYVATAEVRTVNSKGLDLSVRANGAAAHDELWARQRATEVLQRGKVSLSISLEGHLPAGAALDAARLRALYTQLRDLSRELGAKPPRLEGLLAAPGILAEPAAQLDEDAQTLLRQTVDEALAACHTSRLAEGQVLLTDLRHNLALVRQALQDVLPLEAPRLEAIRQRLWTNLKTLNLGPDEPDERFYQEVMYHADRLDVAEERVRLAGHLDALDETLEGPTGQGKRLTFLLQECWREATTLGNKANDLALQQVVLRMKEALERMREQVANVQ